MFRPPPPAPLEWDPEKARTILTGIGRLLHTVDPAARSPHADELWELTERDLAAIAPPAARIANRYDTARTLAGRSDDAGLVLATVPYVQRNLALRGRAKALDAHDEASLNDEHRNRYQPEPPAAERSSQPESQPEQPARRQPESEPEIVDVRLADDPAGAGLAAHPDPDWFDFWGGAGGEPVPHVVSRGD